MLDFLKELHNEALHLTQALKFNKRDERDRIIISLYASMIEQTGTLIILADKLTKQGSDAVFRSMMEGYVDLINTLNNVDYVNHLNAAYHTQWLKVMKQMLAGNNAFLAGFPDKAALDAQIASRQAIKDDLATRKFLPLKIVEKFDKANLMDVYRSFPE